MRVRDALKLHNEDEVTVKKTPEYIGRVIETEVTEDSGRKNVNILLDDGNWYSHKEVK